VVTYEQSVAAARSLFAQRSGNPQMAACLARQVQAAVSPHLPTPVVVRGETIPFPTLGDATVAFRLTTTGSPGHGPSVTSYTDVVTVREGRASFAIATAAAQTFELRLARLVLARLRDTQT
jgi:hypothetical protein